MIKDYHIAVRCERKSYRFHSHIHRTGRLYGGTGDSYEQICCIPHAWFSWLTIGLSWFWLDDQWHVGVSVKQVSQRLKVLRQMSMKQVSTIFQRQIILSHLPCSYRTCIKWVHYGIARHVFPRCPLISFHFQYQFRETIMLLRSAVELSLPDVSFYFVVK